MMQKHGYLISAAAGLCGILIAICSMVVSPDDGFAFYNFNCSSCHTMPPLDGPRDRATGAFRGNHQTHQPLNAHIENCAICHNSVSFTTGHYDGRISFVQNINNSPASGSSFSIIRMAFLASTSADLAWPKASP